MLSLTKFYENWHTFLRDIIRLCLTPAYYTNGAADKNYYILAKKPGPKPEDLIMNIT